MADRPPFGTRRSFTFSRAAFYGVKGWIELNLRILYWIFIAPLRGQRWSLDQTVRQMVLIGVRALPMASLTAFSIGLTLAMQSAVELRKLGASSYIPDLVSVSLLRELGPLLITVIVIGRSGSAVTAELGTMKVGEEIEALEVMAINPIRFLVVPRFLAMMVMLPALTVFGDYIGMVGGWSVCKLSLHFDTGEFIVRAMTRGQPWDFISGLIKSVVFAWLLITVACYKGLAVEGGAEGVGQATTESVVWSLLLMLIANALLTGVFFFAAASPSL